MRRTATVLTALAIGLSVTAVACSEPAPEAADTTEGSTADAPCGGKDVFACARDTTIAELVPDTPTKATGEPLVLGMVNQENTAAGSYPELTQAVQAAIDFTNEQLGGVNGRPIELTVCNTEFSAEGSSACGQQFVEDEVPAVLGGIDVFGNAIDTLADNDIPFIGGIPISTQSVTSPNSFQWSGGSWGAAVAFADHAANVLQAERVAIVYNEFGPVTDSAEVGRDVLEAAGVEATLVPYPVMATDISSALSAAAASDPDAIFMLAADTGCKAGFDGLAALDIDVTRYFVGACATPAIVDEAGADKTDGTLFNIESPLGKYQTNEDFDFYSAVIEEYGPESLDPVSAGTVSFRSFMNLLMVLHDLDGDITPATITAALRAQVDAPSFGGHPYTCDGQQFDGLPAMCSPQQIIAEMQDGKLEQPADWVDVGEIYVG